MEAGACPSIHLVIHRSFREAVNGCNTLPKMNSLETVRYQSISFEYNTLYRGVQAVLGFGFGEVVRQPSASE